MPTPEIPIGIDQLRTLSNAKRLEIYTSLRTDGPASARELADRLSQDELGLYYHLRLLVKHEMLSTDLRPTATKPETVYSVRGRFVVSGLDFEDPAVREVICQNVESITTRAAKEFRRAAGVLGNGLQEHYQIGRLAVRLTPGKADELKARLLELGAWLDENSDPAGDRYSLTFLKLPIVGEK